MEKSLVTDYSLNNYKYAFTYLTNAQIIYSSIYNETYINDYKSTNNDVISAYGLEVKLTIKNTIDVPINNVNNIQLTLINTYGCSCDINNLYIDYVVGTGFYCFVYKNGNGRPNENNINFTKDYFLNKQNPIVTINNNVLGSIYLPKTNSSATIINDLDTFYQKYLDKTQKRIESEKFKQYCFNMNDKYYYNIKIISTSIIKREYLTKESPETTTNSMSITPVYGDYKLI